MTVLPFICLGSGILLGIFIKFPLFLKITDNISTIALSFLMLSIGLGIGLDENIIKNIARIGFNCAIIALSAIAFSVIFTYLCEKAVLPLKRFDDELRGKHLDLTPTQIEDTSSKETTSEQVQQNNLLVWVMPTSLIVGLILGVFSRAFIKSAFVDRTFVIFLIVLYICVGIAQGANREVLIYLKALGFKVLWLSIAIIAGSTVGGFVAGLLLGLPFSTSVIAASGMSFYSLTGAFMTSTYGLEIGTYGFLVNIMREFFTIVSMPLLIKISLGSPIAGGAAGNMDTMLAPITKFVGVRLGLVTLITGTILTFIVPFLLPLLALLLK